MEVTPTSLTLSYLLVRTSICVEPDIDIRQTAAEWARERGYHDIATTIEQAQPARAQDADLDAALVTAARQSDYAEVERLLR